MNISFEKTISREDLYTEVLNRSVDAVYHPRKEKLMPSLGKTVEFNRTRSRPDLFKLKDDINAHSFRLQAIQKKSKKVDLTHARSRRKNVALPLFAQNMHDRFAMSQILQG